MTRKNLAKLGTCFTLSLAIWTIAPIKALVNKHNITNDSVMDDPDSLEPMDEYGELIDYKEPKAHRNPGRTTTKTLPKIIQEALTYHPSIEADKEAFSATEDLVDQAAAGYMPSVDMRISVGRENIRRNFGLNSLNPIQSIGTVATTRSDPSITLRQILFDGMATASRVDRARSQRHQAKGTLGVTTDTATVDSATAIIDVRRLQRLLRIVDQNIKFHQWMKERVAEVVRAGALTISDLHQLEARLQDTYISKATIESDLDVARAKFIEVVGSEPPNYIKHIRFPKYLLPSSVDIAVKMALDNNNAIKVAKSNVQIAETNHRESAAKLVPTVSVELEGERDRNLSATSGFQNRFTAMVVARHNLFSGGADMAKSRETAKRMTETQARLNLARRQTERTIRASWGEVKSSQRKSAHLTKQIAEKRIIRDNYVEEFSIGKRTLTDILDAANDVFLTEASRTTADATTDINTVVLTVGTGQFQHYLCNIDDNGFEEVEVEHKSHFDSRPYSSSGSDVRLTPFSPPSQSKSKTGNEAEAVSFKRKSIFEKRKELRQRELPDKATT